MSGDLAALLGPLGAAVSGDDTDVLVNGPGTVWADGPSGLRRVGVRGLDSEAQVRALAQQLAAAGGRRLDEACPYVDVRLAGGIRVHAVLGSLCRAGTHISLRLPRAGVPSLDQLVRLGTLDDDLAAACAEVVAGGEGIVVCGTTGAGKTTLLAGLLARVPEDQRIVVVEDAAELRVPHPHVVYLEARQANVEGAGAIGLDVLVRQALRMRPDRLVVGEVRGGEIRDLLAALTTGHAGATTLHAPSADGVVERVHVLAQSVGLDPVAAVRQLRAGVGAVLPVRRTDRGRRVVDGLYGWGADGRVLCRVGRRAPA